MKKLVFALILAVPITGCATISLKPPKEPIKVDVSMRLDVYQHVEKDINSIEDIVTSPSENKNETKSPDQSFLNMIVSNAYAEDGLSPEVKDAALRRKDRRPKFVPWQKNAVIGESRSGLLEIKDYVKSDPMVEALVKAENIDRMVIYQSIAQNNNTSIEDVQRMYSERLQQDAPSGTPIEVKGGAGKYDWKIK